MLKFIITLMILFAQLSWANDLEIQVQPREPVFGENFNVLFKIKGSSSAAPEIEFEPNGVQVLGKNASGRSTRTTFINGKLLTETTLNYNYKMTADKKGNVYLKNIKVKLGDKTLSHKNVRIKILNKPKTLAAIFLIAEPSKEKVFIGESIVVNYSIYSKANLQNFTIKRFPKLNHFLKRYQPEKNLVERVNVGNQIYRKRLLYAAQIFPEKIGKVKIDSMSLEAQYAVSRSNILGGINIGRRSLKSKTLKSETVHIEVMPLPTQGMPKGFTGLVGKHDFSLDLNKSKFLLNEPLEIKLKVTGPGALENLDAPSLLNNAGLEEFDVKSDLELTQNYTGSKTFEYVYLTRAPFKTPEKEIRLSYFDPETFKYETKILKLPAIEVVGQMITATRTSRPTSDSNKKVNSGFSDDGSLILAPLSESKSLFTFGRINIGLLVLILILFLYKNRFALFHVQPSDKKALLKTILKDDMSYEKLIQLLNAYDQDFNSFKDFLAKSNLDNESKEYLLELLSQCEKNQYATNKNMKDVKNKFDKKYLKKLIGVLEQ